MGFTPVKFMGHSSFITFGISTHVQTEHVRHWLLVVLILPYMMKNPRKSENKKSERILIKNLPATIPISVIMGYLKGFPQLKLRSNVIYAKERNGDELSPFINGDRLIYVSPNVSPPLPRETIIGGHSCKNLAPFTKQLLQEVCHSWSSHKWCGHVWGIWSRLCCSCFQSR